MSTTHSSVIDFILAGLAQSFNCHSSSCFLEYLVMVVGNMGMILLTTISLGLYSPVYYFLSHLSSIDFLYSSVITPKMLVNFMSERNIISFLECMTQLYFFLIFVIAEGYLLMPWHMTVMLLFVDL